MRVMKREKCPRFSNDASNFSLHTMEDVIFL